MQSKRGFTLIELLVVVSIIGLLSSIVLAALDTAKIKAQDTVTRVNLTTLENGLTAYKNDHATVPPSLGSDGGANVFANSCDGSLQASLQPLLTTHVLPSLPLDSKQCLSYATHINLWSPSMCGGGNITVEYLILFTAQGTHYNLPTWFGSQYCIMGPREN